MQISQQTLATVQTLQANGQYAAAYSAIIQDLNSQGITLQTPGLSAADHDSLQWVTIAQQVNSGAQTEQALEIRAVNKAAVQYELGQSIDLFGPQEQASSNAVANAYLTQVITGNGTIPPLNVSINSDVTAGLGALGVSNAAHAAALPDGLSQIFTGFNNDTYYDGLSPAGQQEANFLHITASAMAAQYNLALSLGYSPTEANAVATSVANDFVAQQKSQNPILLSEESLMNGVGGATQTAASTWSSVQAFAVGVSQTLFGSGNSSSPAATELTSFDGSGTFLADNQILHFSGGYTPNFAVGTNGDVTVAVTPSGGTTPTTTFDLSTNGTQAYVNGSNFFIGLPNGLTSLDAFGNLTFSSPAATLTVPTSGDVTLNIPGANGTTSTLDLGVLPTGAALNAASSQITITLPTGQTVQTLQVVNLHTDGSYEQVIQNTDNVTTNEFNGSGQLLETINANVNGNVGITIFSTDPNSSWYSQSTAKDTNGNVIGTTLVERNGTQQMVFIDPSSGDSTTILQDAQGHWSNVSLGNTFNNYVQGIGDALASQIISGILIKNDLPASAAATAFTDAVIAHEAPVPGQVVDFRSEFATSIFSVAGGIGGSEVGGDLAQLLGLPYQVGSIAGGTAGGLVGAYLAQQAANAVGIPVSQADILTTANFETGLAGAAGAYIGSQLAGLVMPTNEGGEVTGAVATTAATLAVLTFEFSQPELLILTTFLSAIGADFVGTLIGDVIGDLFGDGYRGRPFANAGIQISNGQFAIMGTGVDNNGDVQEAVTLATDAIQIDNEILATIGGTATSSSNWSIGYHGSDYHSELTAQLPNETDYGDPTSAVSAAVIGALRNTNITGGNLYMEYVLATTTQTSLQALDYDLNAARDYSLYVADPVSFDIALALGTQAQYDAWQAEYARAQQLGLTGVSFDFSGSQVVTQLVPTSSGTPVLSLGLGDPGDSVTLSNADINFAEGANNGIVNGSNNLVLLGTGLTGMVVFGNNNSFAFNNDPNGGGEISLGIGGSNDTVTLSNATLINFSEHNGGERVNGNQDTIHFGTAVSGVVAGNNDTISFDGDPDGGSGISLGIAGSNDTANLSNAAQIDFTQGSTNGWVNGSGDAILVGTGVVGTVIVGNNDTVGFDNDSNGGGNVGIGVVGANDTVNLSNAGQINFGEGSSNGHVNGSFDTINFGTGVSMTVTGSNDTLSFNNDPNGGGGATLSIIGSSDVINAKAGDLVNISGNGQNGAADSVNVTGGAVSVSSNANAVVSGSGNTVTVTGDSAAITDNGSSDTTTLSGSGDTATMTGTGNVAAATHANETVIAQGASEGIVLYDADSASVSGNSDTTALYGTGATVVVSGANDSTTEFGAGETMTISGGASDTTLAATSSSADTIVLSGAGETATINGTSDGTLTTGANDLTLMYGNGDAVNMFGTGDQAAAVGINDVINAYGSSQGVVLYGADTGNVSGNSDTTAMYGTGAIANVTGTNDSTTEYGTGETANITGASAVTLISGNGNAVTTTGTNDSTYVSGSNNVVNLGVSGATVTLNAGALNESLAGSNASINVANGDSFNLAGSHDTVIASNGTVHLNANTTNITIEGSNETIHVQAGDTYAIIGSGDTVITDTVTAAQNGTTAASYNGVSSLVDVTNLSYDSSITAQFALNSGGFAAQILVSDHGSLVDTINLQSVQNLGSLTVRSDGSGGTLLVDPPLSSTNQDSTHQSFTDAWHLLMGRTDVGASLSHDVGQQFDFSALTPNAPTPEDQHNSVRDFSQQDAAFIRDGPSQNAQPTDTVAVPPAAPHNYADMKFDFSSLPSHPVSSDMLDYHLEVFSQAAAAITGDVSSPHHQLPEFHSPLEPDHHDFLAHLAPSHGWHL